VAGALRRELHAQRVQAKVVGSSQHSPASAKGIAHLCCPLRASMR
jgi:hypothetical protein